MSDVTGSFAVQWLWIGDAPENSLDGLQRPLTTSRAGALVAEIARVVPEQLDFHSSWGLFRFLSELDDACFAQGPVDSIKLDCSQLRFVDPLGLCALAHTLETLEAVGIEVHVEELSANLSGYLDRMDLFKACKVTGAASMVGMRRSRETSLVELRSLDDHARVDELASRLTTAVVGGMPEVGCVEDPDGMYANPMEQLSVTLQYVLVELLENALTHGRTRGYNTAKVWVAAQYYPRKENIRLAIVDNGCGFLETLRGHPKLAHEMHLDAIETALAPRVSRNRDVDLGTDARNQGIGLTMIREIARNSRGKMSLCSGDGWLLDVHTGKTFRNTIPPWQGVAASLELYRPSLLAVNISSITRGLPGYEVSLDLRFED